MKWLLVFVLTFWVFGAQAQKDKKAEAILSAVGDKYQALKSFKVVFTYLPEGGESFKGEAITLGKKFNLKLAGQEILNDGKTMATFIKETNEVNIQDFDPEEAGAFNPAEIYTAYKKGFDYKYLGETKEAGKTLEGVELIPTGENGEVKNISIKIDKSDKSIKSWVVTNKDDSKTTYTIDEFTPNPSTPDNLFTFDPAKFPGVEIIDLR